MGEQPLKIAHFIDTNVIGGAERMLLELALSSAQDGAEVTVLHFGSSVLVKECALLGLRERTVPGHRWYKSIATVPLFAARFSRFLVAGGWDVLHSHLWGPITAAALGARLAGMRHVGTLHDVYVVEERPSRIRLLRLACLLGTKLVAVSHSIANRFGELAPSLSNQISVIRNGLPDVDSWPSREEARESIPEVGPRDFVVVIPARLVALKRFDILFDILEQLLPQYSLKVLIAGTGPMENVLKQEIAERFSGGEVQLLGFRTDIHELLGASDCIFLTSESEGLPTSVLEAMRAGRTTIAFDVGGVGELITHEKTGMLVPFADTDSFVKYAKVLLEDSEMVERLGNAARKEFEMRFTVDKMNAKYWQLYQPNRS